MKYISILALILGAGLVSGELTEEGTKQITQLVTQLRDPTERVITSVELALHRPVPDDLKSQRTYLAELLDTLDNLNIAATPKQFQEAFQEYTDAMKAVLHFQRNSPADGNELLGKLLSEKVPSETEHDEAFGDVRRKAKRAQDRLFAVATEVTPPLSETDKEVRKKIREAFKKYRKPETP